MNYFLFFGLVNGAAIETLVGLGEPGMVSHFLKAHTFVWVRQQYLLAKVLRLIRECVKWANSVITLLEVEVGDIRVGIVLAAACEGCLASEKLERENSDGPKINLGIVGLLVD